MEELLAASGDGLPPAGPAGLGRRPRPQERTHRHRDLRNQEDAAQPLSPDLPLRTHPGPGPVLTAC